MIKPAAEVVADLGNFLFTKQWFTDSNDPFHRAPVSDDLRSRPRSHRDAGRPRWIAGLQDEGGAGSWVAAAMKEFGQPNKEEVEKFQQFVDGVLWGGIQYTNGPTQIRRAQEPVLLRPERHHRITTSAAFATAAGPVGTRRDSERIDRAYNYPHVVAAYWTMYRLARNHNGLVTNHPWDWYLNRLTRRRSS